MNRIPLLLCGTLLFASCKNDSKEKEAVTPGIQLALVKDSFAHPSAKELYQQKEAIDEKKLENGLIIKWLSHGKGEKIAKGDVLKINYELNLEDGTVVDGNQFMNRSWLPSIVGYQQQIDGWEQAYSYLKVGDLVEIFIPSALARGEKGIKDKKTGKYFIPPNANNILKLKIGGKIAPSKTMDGVKVWLLEEDSKIPKSDTITLTNEVDIHYMVSSESKRTYDMSYRRNVPYTLRFSDYGVVSGLKIALLGMKNHDKVWITVPSSHAYGDKGYLDYVKPNESLFYNIIIYEVR